jgi:hypothetical protein
MKDRPFSSQFIPLGTLALLFLLAVTPSAYGQFQGENIRGDYGVNSGTMGPPGLYVIMPYYQQNADRIKDADGNLLLPGVFQGFDMRLVLPTIYVVTSKKLLGANYGFTATIPFTAFRPERTSAQTNQAGWGLTDTYFAPINLGWTKKRADFIVGYAFNAPTGTYEVGGSENNGLGMWSHEIQGGTTVYLDSAKKYSVATSAFLEFHSKKKDQDLKVGDILTLEGGAAYNIESIGGAFGFGYSFQGKVTNDSGSELPVLELKATNLYGKNRVFSIGPDITTGVFEHGRTAGLLNIRYFWESGARSTFEGGTLFVSFTLMRTSK